MTTHHAPFQSATHLPIDLALGAWIILTVYATDAWTDTARPWLARTLTSWGARLG